MTERAQTRDTDSRGATADLRLKSKAGVGISTGTSRNTARWGEETPGQGQQMFLDQALFHRQTQPTTTRPPSNADTPVGALTAGAVLNPTGTRATQAELSSSYVLLAKAVLSGFFEGGTSPKTTERRAKNRCASARFLGYCNATINCDITSTSSVTAIVPKESPWGVWHHATLNSAARDLPGQLTL